MSHMMRSSLKFYSSCGFVNKSRSTKSECAKQRLYSTLWNIGMKSMENDAVKFIAVSNKFTIPMKQYFKKIRRTSETKFVEYLQRKIKEVEKKPMQAMHSFYKILPSKIDDFEVELDGAGVTLVKSLPGETITVSFNINDSQDFDDEYMSDEFQLNGYEVCLTKPKFSVDVKKGDTTLAFKCHCLTSFEELGDSSEKEEISDSDANSDTEELFETDVFRIDSFVLYREKPEKRVIWKEMPKSAISKNFYDLMENFLNLEKF